MLDREKEHAALERTAAFRTAWAEHVKGNSFYDLDRMSQPEIDSFRFAFACGYLEGQRGPQPDAYFRPVWYP